MLISIRNVNGWLILSIVWTLAMIGIFSEIFLSGRAIKICQVIIYLCMGWACSLYLGCIKAALPGVGFLGLMSGGIA
jgi:hemolysin III